jgi:hypothetical protein
MGLQHRSSVLSEAGFALTHDERIWLVGVPAPVQQGVALLAREIEAHSEWLPGCTISGPTQLRIGLSVEPRWRFTATYYLAGVAGARRCEYIVERDGSSNAVTPFEVLA